MIWIKNMDEYLKKSVELFIISIWKNNLISKKYLDFNITQLNSIFAYPKEVEVDSYNQYLIKTSWIVFNYPIESLFENINFKNIKLKNFINGSQYDFVSLLKIVSKSIENDNVRVDEKGIICFYNSNFEINGDPISISIVNFGHFLSELFKMSQVFLSQDDTSLVCDDLSK